MSQPMTFWHVILIILSTWHIVQVVDLDGIIVMVDKREALISNPTLSGLVTFPFCFGYP